MNKGRGSSWGEVAGSYPEFLMLVHLETAVAKKINVSDTFSQKIIDFQPQKFIMTFFSH